MSISTVRQQIHDRLPDDAAMGSLRRHSPGLYYLAIVVTLAVYAGICLGIALALLLTLATGVQALTAAVSGAWLPTLQWYGLVVLGLALGGVTSWLALRWIALARGGD